MFVLLPCFLILGSAQSLSTSSKSFRSDCSGLNFNRRDALLKTIVTGASTLWIPSSVYAINYDDCLSDLPAIDTNYSKRIFMCRHGETEFNRLKKVQGARIDASLNETGERQARALGRALSQVSPQVIYHSNLLRAKQTASIASQQLSSSPSLECLPSLKEIDFGDTAEGAPVSMYRAQMTATYAAWTMGDNEARMTADGENLTQVQDRVRAATRTMLDSNASYIAAVSHSSYLRVFLSTVDKGFKMAQASSLQIPNCSIHVVDFDKAHQAWNGRTIRTSEARHLVAL